MRKNRNRYERFGSIAIALLVLVLLYLAVSAADRNRRGGGEGSVAGSSTAAAVTEAAATEPKAGSISEESSAQIETHPEQQTDTTARAQLEYEEIPYYRPEISAGELPAVFDRRTVAGLPSVKDQGELGTCWAFAAMTALESSLEEGEQLDFSEDHMSNNKNFILSQREGGEYTMALAYLLSWQGPVLEEQDPYGDGYSPEGLSAVKHLQEAQFLPSKDYTAIKMAVLLRGGVQSSLYTQLKNAKSESRYYDRETYAYCYDGNQLSNHEVVIIGWDDEFSRENFSIEVPGDGAFLCVNSWGRGFGDDGFFYVSYYDTNIGIHNVLYTRMENADNYDTIYQSDLCGWIGTLGYGEEEAWAANVFQAGAQEYLGAAGFYAAGENTGYELYLVRHVGEMPDFADRRLLAEGSVRYSGYYTIPLRAPILLNQAERFAVVMKLTTPDSVHPIAIEYDAGDKKSRIDLSDGEGYISVKGDNWESAEQEQKCNLCIKAYTKRYQPDGEGR